MKYKVYLRGALILNYLPDNQGFYELASFKIVVFRRIPLKQFQVSFSSRRPVKPALTNISSSGKYLSLTFAAKKISPEKCSFDLKKTFPEFLQNRTSPPQYNYLLKQSSFTK